MRIRYNTRKSSFYDQVERKLTELADELSKGNTITVLENKNYQYKDEEMDVLIEEDKRDQFLTDWWMKQASLFPARVKSVCTVMRDMRLWGHYHIANGPRGLTVSSLASGKMQTSFSWDVVSSTVVIADKNLDKSAFLHRGTGIPLEMLWVFGIQDQQSQEEVKVLLNHKDHDYEASVTKDKHGRYRLFWNADFTELLKSKLPTFFKIHENGEKPDQNCWLRFEKIGDGFYEIHFSTEGKEREAKAIKETAKADSSKVPITGYWTFISNPKVWTDVYGVIDRESEFNHQVRDSDVKSIAPGHLGIMRVGIDGRNASERNGGPKKPAGIYAIVEITSKAYLRPEEPISDLEQSDEKQRRTHIVDIRFVTKLISKPLTIDFLKTQRKITDKYLINSHQSSSIPLNEESFEEILRLADAKEEIGSELDRSLKENSSKEIAKKYKNASPRMVERVSRRYERGTEGEEVKRLAGRKCQISEAMGLTPYSFKKKNGDNYCEAHHVVPVSTGEEGTLHPSNVICVSADRHRQLHYGDAKVVDIRDDEFEFLIDGETVIVPKLIRGD